MPTSLPTFVMCVESGPLEEMTLRCVQSLRRWGGALAQSPVVAVKPRFGFALKRQTLQQFDELGITYLDLPRANKKYGWYGLMNKPYAIAEVRQRVGGDVMGFLDGDMLVVAEPAELLLSPEESFAACAPDKGLGSTGPDDPRDAYWQQMCKALAVPIDSLPFIDTCQEEARIRLYWNSGVFVFRSSSGFAEAYLDLCVRAMKSRIASHDAGVHFLEQAVLGMAMAKLHLPWRALSKWSNFTVEGWTKQFPPTEQMKQARILHYHNAMAPAAWDRWLVALEASHPEVNRWLAPQGPIDGSNTGVNNLAARSLRAMRSVRRQIFLARCRKY